MAVSPLPDNDCHSQLRSDIIAKAQLTSDEICISVAWDWMYRGMSIKGMHNELQCCLKNAALARENGLQSLAIPETATFALAKSLLSTYHGNSNHIATACVTKVPKFCPSILDKLQGIENSLREIVSRHKNAYNSINGDAGLVSATPNSWQNPDLFTLDPFGSCDYFCSICFQELSNLYMHCEGCEILLSKDFNICTSCYLDGRHLSNIQMHPLIPKKHATLNHTGDNKFERKSHCPCKNGPCCKTCDYCLGCSCRCHKHFSVNFRFMTIEEEILLLKRIEDIIYTQNGQVIMNDTKGSGTNVRFDSKQKSGDDCDGKNTDCNDSNEIEMLENGRDLNLYIKAASQVMDDCGGKNTNCNDFNEIEMLENAGDLNLDIKAASQVKHDDQTKDSSECLQYNDNGINKDEKVKNGESSEVNDVGSTKDSSERKSKYSIDDSEKCASLVMDKNTNCNDFNEIEMLENACDLNLDIKAASQVKHDDQTKDSSECLQYNDNGINKDEKVKNSDSYGESSEVNDVGSTKDSSERKSKYSIDDSEKCASLVMDLVSPTDIKRSCLVRRNSYY